MAVKVSSADSIKQAILADVLLRELIEKIEVNRTGLAPIALGPSIGISGIPQIEGLEASWHLTVMGLTGEESRQFIQVLRNIFPGSVYKTEESTIKVEIFSLVTKDVLTSIDEQKRIQKEEESRYKLDLAIKYATKLKNGADGAKGKDGQPGPPGPRGEKGEQGIPGKDGKDLVATETTLNDLKDVYAIDPKIGQVLTWDGSDWVSLFVPQIHRYSSGNTELDCGDFDP